MVWWDQNQLFEVRWTQMGVEEVRSVQRDYQVWWRFFVEHCKFFVISLAPQESLYVVKVRGGGNVYREWVLGQLETMIPLAFVPVGCAHPVGPDFTTSLPSGIRSVCSFPIVPLNLAQGTHQARNIKESIKAVTSYLSEVGGVWSGYKPHAKRWVPTSKCHACWSPRR